MSEDHPLRGNDVFPYARHKRLVEERLAQARERHPALEQVILRLGTVLGETADNQITRYFEQPILVGIRGSDSRFVFVWDEDVAACLEHALDESPPGIFNVAGDGVVTLREMAHSMGKRYVELPAPWMRTALRVGKSLGWTHRGPEQTLFVQYRPVLANRRLREVFAIPRADVPKRLRAFCTAVRQVTDDEG